MLSSRGPGQRLQHCSVCVCVQRWGAGCRCWLNDSQHRFPHFAIDLPLPELASSLDGDTQRREVEATALMPSFGVLCTCVMEGEN